MLASNGELTPPWGSMPLAPTGAFSANFHFADGRRVLISPRLVVEPGWADLERAFAR